MHPFTIRRATRVLGACLVAVGLALAACSSQPSNPVTPTPPAPTASVSQTLTITADGVFPSLAYIDANLPVTIVNKDTVSHLLHLDVEDQPGCSAFDQAGEIPAGESRTTGVITSDSAGCDVHDHAKHGDKRFSVQLVVGEG
jgi:hypothetical protein